MPHWLIHGAGIAGRVVAFGLACFCFYVAVFMYEDEEGVWQNSLEKLWMAVYDRAQMTNSTATALFNKLAGRITSWFDRVFGKRLLSTTSVLVSTALSVSVCTFFLFCDAITKHSIRKDIALENLAITVVLLPATLFTTNMHKAKRIALLATVVVAPIAIFTYMFARGGEGPSHERIAVEGTLLSLTLSFACDSISITLIRRIVARIATTASGLRVGYGIVAVVSVAVLAELLPLAFAAAAYGVVSLEKHQNELSSVLGVGGLYALLLSLTTMSYCIAPLLVLLVALLHKLLWPSLSRLIYAMYRYDILKNKKMLISLGATCLAIAFNLQKAGLRELLKHLS